MLKVMLTQAWDSAAVQRYGLIIASARIAHRLAGVGTRARRLRFVGSGRRGLGEPDKLVAEAGALAAAAPYKRDHNHGLARHMDGDDVEGR